MPDATQATITVFLGILAAVSAVEVVALIALVRLTRSMNARLGDLQRQLLLLGERIDAVGQSIERTVADVRTITRRATVGGARAQLAFDTAASVATLAMSTGGASLATRGARLIAIARGLGGAYRILTGQRPGRQSRRQDRETRPLEEVVDGA